MRAPRVELLITVPEGWTTESLVALLSQGVPLRLEATGLRFHPRTGQQLAALEPAALRFTAETSAVTLSPLPPEDRFNEIGHCSYCQQSARRNPAGAWWHLNGPCRGVGHEPTIQFIPEAS